MDHKTERAAISNGDKMGDVSSHKKLWLHHSSPTGDDDGETERERGLELARGILRISETIQRQTRKMDEKRRKRKK